MEMLVIGVIGNHQSLLPGSTMIGKYLHKKNKAKTFGTIWKAA